MPYSIPSRLIKLVRERAQNRCEYCRMVQDIQGATFHIEHIVPLAKGGKTNSTNLALACPSCNLNKSDRVESIDPLTDRLAPLFNPRKDEWFDHFHYDRSEIIGITAIGRTTVILLKFNDERRLRIREIERLLGW